MDYQQARDYLAGLNKFGSVLGLASIRELMHRLGDPQNHMKFVHVAGTNGKGSVCSFIASILQEAGYHVGRYSSPAVFGYREIIQKDGQPISREDLVYLASKVKEACESMIADGLPHPTVFEAETAIAFLYFVYSGCDIAVVECGLGGLGDATNIIADTQVAVITSVSLDHMAILGNTLGEIAANKAGIIKPGCSVCAMEQEKEVTDVIHEKFLACASSELDVSNPALKGPMSELRLAGTSPLRLMPESRSLAGQSFTYMSSSGREYPHMQTSLAGFYQLSNAALAIEAAECLENRGYHVAEHVAEGLMAATWPGRFEVLFHPGTKVPISKNSDASVASGNCPNSVTPLVILDGAHNRDGARALEQTIRTLLPDKEVILLFGMFADKEVDIVSSILTPLAKRVITVQTPGSERALPALKLKDIVQEYNPEVMAANSIEQAVKEALYEVEQKPDTVIIACGSLSHLKYFKKEFNRILAGVYEDFE